MKFEDHCKESVEKFGLPFKEVHEWLDFYAGSSEYGMKHRGKRHHVEGIKETGKMFGKMAEEAARQHVISDLKEEGWKESDHFPENERDYIRMGLF